MLNDAVNQTLSRNIILAGITLTVVVYSVCLRRTGNSRLLVRFAHRRAFRVLHDAGHRRRRCCCGCSTAAHVQRVAQPETGPRRGTGGRRHGPEDISGKVIEFADSRRLCRPREDFCRKPALKSIVDNAALWTGRASSAVVPLFAAALRENALEVHSVDWLCRNDAPGAGRGVPRSVRTSRVFTAAGVLGAGMIAAMPFRQTSVRLPEPAPAKKPIELTLRRPMSR